MKTKSLAIIFLLLIGILYLAHNRHQEGWNARSAAVLRPPPSVLRPPAAPPLSTVAALIIPLPPIPSHSRSAISPILDPTQNPLTRQTLARNLKRNLNPSELQALYAFLLAHHDEDETQLGHVLKNYLMEALCAQDTPPIDLNRILSQLYHDHTQNVVIRDYAIQHLAILDQTLAATTSWPEAESKSQRAEIHALLREALAETDSSIAGTALLALNSPGPSPDVRPPSSGPAPVHADVRPPSSGVQPVRPPSQSDPNDLAETALRLASDSEASSPSRSFRAKAGSPSRSFLAKAGPLARITAIQVCGERRLKESIPILLKIAANDPDTSTRISAIGALGLLGGSLELQLLNQLKQENNPRLNPAVMLALHRVQQRLPNP